MSSRIRQLEKLRRLTAEARTPEEKRRLTAETKALRNELVRESNQTPPHATPPEMGGKFVAQPSAPGLGDTMGAFLASFGVTPETYRAAKAEFGLPPTCNCDARKEWLNKFGDRFGYSNLIGKLNTWLQN